MTHSVPKESRMGRILSYVSVAAVIGLIWFFFQLDATAKTALAKADENAEILKIQAQTSLEIAKVANKIGNQLDLLFKLGQIDKNMLKELRALPKTPVDSLGVLNPKFYIVENGELYIVKIPDSCHLDVLTISLDK